MNHGNLPSPAIVSEAATRRLPRWALVLLCLAYVVPGYIGRDPWKGADLDSFGTMLELLHASGITAWLDPTMLTLAGEPATLLPYWLGSWALKLTSGWLAPDLAVRLPFMALLAGVLAATWHATFHLARDPAAAPVVFAFGGEAPRDDYARTLADGALLALVATLGLAQFSHETAPALAQLCATSLTFYGLAALPRKTVAAPVALGCGVLALSISGAPAIALIYAAAAWATLLLPVAQQLNPARKRRAQWLLAFLTLASFVLLTWFARHGWQVAPLRTDADSWRSLSQLLAWFTWPVWPFVLWALWRWRGHLHRLAHNRHMGLPLLLAGVPLVAAVGSNAGDRVLLLALPPLATLAAFALPTFKRGASALIDWFTVLFFSGWAIVIWIVWISLQTGIPAKPAANVARLAPGFQPSFHLAAFAVALVATLSWMFLARWRTARHRPALWKSLVLPAAGTTLCWLLLMTLWLPALNYGRSLAPQIAAVRQLVGPGVSCVAVFGLSNSQIAAARFHAGWETVPLPEAAHCPVLLSSPQAGTALASQPGANRWRAVGAVPRPTSRSEELLVWRLRAAH